MMNGTSDMADFVAKLRGEFLDEAQQLLEECEESFLKLEDASLRERELARIFRAAHTIKGSGATVGLRDLVAFAHAVEDCLSALRARPERLTTEIITLLLRSGDALRTRIDLLRC